MSKKLHGPRFLLTLPQPKPKCYVIFREKRMRLDGSFFFLPLCFPVSAIDNYES
jgi:hypothetical protein